MRSLLFIGVIFFCLVFRVNASLVVLNGLTHVHNTLDGGEILGKVKVRNDGNSAIRVLIYKQDLISECGKSIDYQETGKLKSSLNQWLKVNVDEKVLEAKEEYDILYTISFPKTNVKNGSYWQILMIESTDPIKEEINNGLQVNSRIRYGVQLVTNVGALESPKLSFHTMTVEKSPNPLINVAIKNEGDFSVMVKLKLEIYDEDGGKVKVIENLPRRVYPDFCNTFTLELGNIPKGKYIGLLVADNGTDLFGSNLTLEI